MWFAFFILWSEEEKKMFNCCNRYNYYNAYDCNYVNRPFCNLRPISNCNPNLRSSCPEEWFDNSWNNSWNCNSSWNNSWNNNWNNDCFWPNNNCVRPNCNNSCFNPNLIWFLGGIRCGSRNLNRC